MQVWVVSPDMEGNGGKTLERWKDIIRRDEAVFMGWPPKRSKDGRQRLGQKFSGTAKGCVESGDLILSAYREDGLWHLVACGKVNSPVRVDPKLRDEWDYETYNRKLEPFVPLRDRPSSMQLSFKGTTADGRSRAHPRRVIPALVKLKPDSNRADKQLCEGLLRLLKQSAKPPDAITPLIEDAYLRVSPRQRTIIRPRHKELSNAFTSWLRQRGYEVVGREQERVDVDFLDGTTTCRAELKVCYGVKTSQAIREALGQLLEYNYYPYQNRKPAKKWFVVLDERPTDPDVEFINTLRTTMKFPLSICWRAGNTFQTKKW
jgi:hypothetical protein